MSVPARSHSAGPQPRTTPSLDSGRAARCTYGLRVIAEELHTLSESLMLAAYSDGSPAEIARLLAGMNTLLQKEAGALVVRQRSQGKPLTGIATELGLSEDRLRKKYPPEKVDQQLAAHKRLVCSRPSEGRSTVALQPEWRQPYQRVAAALTRMVHESNTSQRQVATALQVDPSYISRLLSGEREASWLHVKEVCDVCGVEPELLEPLWEVAAGVPANSDKPVQYLRTYLRALHYAAGSPGEGRVLDSAPGLTDHRLQQALEGPGVPHWDVIAQVVTAFKGLPQTAHQMWQQARYIHETGPAPAEVFG
ncbi:MULTISPECIES: helix-turn-helix transcriptional regulator [unclassified Streptomyces]|uniref:helix-turn-helix domain-containing protein n=1 Tax=unclassified Streptomyces TaxID=2593676 RepID=UPI002DD80C63|nr:MULTISPECIES: helix-turn-helix transcriptional regulator [unclassified Streptomyces]WSA97588.1 helix-turn-helix transcriptional regulator [Streptomyces sp. NBC_01795]WSB82164.1 helix-turn-helix transcriptional regulator [Streptomyces sp. NBC_01775]WSS18135.1 helix-turn-helix transcriptional regulator [Streptomyces sp. NBC_01186]WSS47136.1 helix-turn-helix transcriptional regulator [Streptomyces sp. NBC_01187]